MTTEMTEAEWQTAERRDPLRFQINLGDMADVVEVTAEHKDSYDAIVVWSNYAQHATSFTLPKKYVEQGIAQRVGGYTYVEPEMPPFFRDPRVWMAGLCLLIALIPLYGLASIWPDAPQGLPTDFFLEEQR